MRRKFIQYDLKFFIEFFDFNVISRFLLGEEVGNVLLPGNQIQARRHTIPSSLRKLKVCNCTKLAMPGSLFLKAESSPLRIFRPWWKQASGEPAHLSSVCDQTSPQAKLRLHFLLLIHTSKYSGKARNLVCFFKWRMNRIVDFLIRSKDIYYFKSNQEIPHGGILESF